ncbi:hypothetical protein FE257_009014 [Aspergillus nanangensis]|uniref:Uncharacterized protein n=1 Tax=Aspergillus nanangensis TaxID=2582783 RepID=A0AAD4GYI7_ASPNN|nr:hypothetical protein FE257_009014 [Aspergillus nanangensis]
MSEVEGPYTVAANMLPTATPQVLAADPRYPPSSPVAMMDGACPPAPPMPNPAEQVAAVPSPPISTSMPTLASTLVTNLNASPLDRVVDVFNSHFPPPPNNGNTLVAPARSPLHNRKTPDPNDAIDPVEPPGPLAVAAFGTFFMAQFIAVFPYAVTFTIAMAAISILGALALTPFGLFFLLPAAVLSSLAALRYNIASI